MDIFLLGFWSGLGLAIPLGPMAILLIAITMAKGKRTGFFGALAMATVDFSYALLVFSLGSLMLQAITPLIYPLRIVGSVLLVIVAISIFRNAKELNLRKKSLADSATRTPLVTFATFFGLTVINPATAFYFLAITPSVSSVSAANGLSEGFILFAAGVFIGSVIWQLTLVLAADWLSGKMTSSLQRRLQYFGAALIAVLAVWLLIR